MNPPDSHQAADPAFDAFLSEVGVSVETDLAHDGGFPDFAAVVAMAHSLDPQRVPHHAVTEVAQFAPVVPLAAQRRRRITRDDIAMADLLADVRAAVDVDVAEAFAVRVGWAAAPAVVPRADRAVADPPAASAPSRRVWGAVLAVAAAVLLVGGGVVTAVRLTAAHDVEPGQAALQEERVETHEGHAEFRTPAARRGTPQRIFAPAPSAPSATTLPPESEAVVHDPVVTPKRRDQPSLQELDAAARQAWRAGDRDEAQRLFTNVVARGGRGKLAEMAYGDLMSIARQQGTPGTEAALWRAYLQRFPRGTFADDAQAGLCRRASGQAAGTCWRGYLAAFPEGTHAKAATRALASDPVAP